MATMSDWAKSEEPRAKTEDNGFFYEKLSGYREREYPMLFGGGYARPPVLNKSLTALDRYYISGSCRYNGISQIFDRRIF